MTHRAIRRSHQSLRRGFLRNYRPAILIQRHFPMCAMARHTHTHRQTVRLRNTVFSLDRTMTRLAFHSRRHVTTVIKSDVIGEIINLGPFDWLVLGQRSRDLLNFNRVFANLRVTIHARARSRNPCDRRFLGSRMTVKTLDLVITSVDLM